VRAELNISYKQGNMTSLLESLYGQNDPAALRASALAGKTPHSASKISYSAFTPGLIVMASIAERKLELYIESSGGRLREGAIGVWNAIRDEGKALKSKLGALVLVDEDAYDVIATASVAVGGGLARADLFLPVATGLVTAVVLAGAKIFGQVSADFLYGSATALAVAILSIGRLLWPSRSKELVWR
jgi:hypothetical protein